MAQKLCLKFLGDCDVIQDGQPVTGFVSRKAQALLCYLAISGRPQPRSALAELLWGRMTQSKANTNLRKVLSNLRHLVGDYLLITPQTAAWNPTRPYFLDTETFSQGVKQALASRAGGLTAETAASLQEAVELYRGDFLAGFHLRGAPGFEEWALLQRERLRDLALQALHVLVEHHRLRGENETAIAQATRLLELDPWQEEIHRQLMRLLARSGRRSAALAQYQTCRRLLAQELDVDPMPETTALYQRIRSAPAQHPRLPPQPTPFVGRQEELAGITRRLDDPSCRLLTLVGPGGIGKTRLALQAAQARQAAFLDGVHFAPLAALGSPEFLAHAIADALHLPIHDRGSPQQQLLDYLREKECLLLLDNLEHLLQGTDLLADVLQQAPQVKILVTSRERLNLRWERLFDVPGLPYPQDEAAGPVETYGAVQLFAQGAHRVQPGFALEREAPAVAHICRLVQGMPLAIELAAAERRSRPCQEIALEIERSMDLLSTQLRDVPPRHRSIRATFEASWQLLSEAEQHTLSQLSVFRGGFNREAAREVAGAATPQLQTLVGKSLLRETPSGRYEMHPLLRQYAAEKLAGQPDLLEQARGRHWRHYAGLVQRQQEHLHTDRSPQALAILRQEIENLQLGWHWAVDRGDWAGIGQAMDGLTGFYQLQGPYEQGERLLAQALHGLQQQLTEAGTKRRRGDIDSAIQGSPNRCVTPQPATQEARSLLLTHLLVQQAGLLYTLGRYEQCDAAVERALQQAERVPPDLAREQHGRVIALGHLYWGQSLILQGAPDKAIVHLEQALQQAQALSLRPLEAECLQRQGSAAYYQGDLATAQNYFERAIDFHSELGQRRGASQSQCNLAAVLLAQGDPGTARQAYEQAVRTYREMGDRRNEAITLGNLGVVLAYLADYSRARQTLERAADLHHELGDRAHQAIALGNLGWLLFEQLGHGDGRRYLERALTLLRESGHHSAEWNNLTSLAQGFHRTGDYERARQYTQMALDMHRDSDAPHHYTHTLAILGHSLLGLGQLEQAAEHYQQALAMWQEIDDPRQAMDTLAGLAQIYLARQQPREALALAEEILPLLERYASTDEWPFFSYLACYHVLQANQDPRAQGILQNAYQLLQEQAARIEDEDLRRSFLENVVVHREIRQLAADQALPEK